MVNTKRIDPFYSTAKWRDLRLTVIARDGGKCQYCGKRGIQADHVIPRRKGGPDEVGNLVCACARCNSLVGGRAFPNFDMKKNWIVKRIPREEEIEREGMKVTICYDQIPNKKSKKRRRRRPR